MGYMILEESLYHEYPVYDYPKTGLGNSFIDEHYLKEKFEIPFVFGIKCPQNDHPGHYFGGVIPVVSQVFIDMLKRAGVDNFQTFPATLVNREKTCNGKAILPLMPLGLLKPLI
ncbi:MAG: hypothetical protein L3J89_10525 [Gammaproteobacteria bacterium]|nr:hypothetical protein [Gammaproteobacteria bacterium]